MKINTLFFLFIAIFSIAQKGNPEPIYYDEFNWNLNGFELKQALSEKITKTQSRFLTYTPGVWEASKITDLDPNDASKSNVLLIYGFDNSNICPTNTSDFHRRRSKFSNGGNSNCDWNREHVYPRSLGTPNLGYENAGADAHHLRPSDVDFNSLRSNFKFVNGSGIAKVIDGKYWYPGDEWKGDVARMMMYMYLRYPTQCLPINVGVGNSADTDIYMIDLFLQWNAEDPVSELEDNRNTYHGNLNNVYAQGNRNPFIDNPFLATKIWGGVVAENRWQILSNSFYDQLDDVIDVFPNPSYTGKLQVSSKKQIDIIEVHNLNGQLIYQINKPNFDSNTYEISGLKQGFYLLNLINQNKKTSKKIIIYSSI